MTIALAVKVHDGIVLAADSATTMMSLGSGGTPTVQNVYNNANKVFNLYKGLPIGALTWDAGSIGSASIATLAKDLRRRLGGGDSSRADWALDATSYTIEAVAIRAREFLFDELYAPLYTGVAGAKPSLSFVVAGYSAGAPQAEGWLIEITRDGTCAAPSLWIPPDDTGVAAGGQYEVINRIIHGYGTGLPEVFKSLGVAPTDIPNVMAQIDVRLRVDLAPAPMPIQDAIDLAFFLADATAMYSRFTPGPNSVGGPIEIAAITKHEGYKWVQRKHYYDVAFNPREGQ